MYSIFKHIEIELVKEDIRSILDSMDDEELYNMGYNRGATTSKLNQVRVDFEEFLKHYNGETYSHQRILLDRIKKNLNI